MGLEQDHTYTQTDDVTYPLDGQWRCVHTHGHRRWPVCVLLFFFMMVTFELKFEVGSERKKKIRHLFNSAFNNSLRLSHEFIFSMNMHYAKTCTTPNLHFGQPSYRSWPRSWSVCYFWTCTLTSLVDFFFSFLLFCMHSQKWYYETTTLERKIYRRFKSTFAKHSPS